MSPNYPPFTLEVDDEAIETIAGALFERDLRGHLDDTMRVRSARVYKNKVYEVLERAATLQRVKARKP